MVLRNLMTQVQAYAGGFARSLGGEEGVEDFLNDGRLNTCAVVADDDVGMVVNPADSECHLRMVGFVLIMLADSLLVDGRDAVAQQTQEDFVQLIAIAVDEHLSVRQVKAE